MREAPLRLRQRVLGSFRKNGASAVIASASTAFEGSMNSTPATLNVWAANSQAHDFSKRNWVRFARFPVFGFEPQVPNLHEAWQRRDNALLS
jgi:hypothetical protein